MKNIIIDTDPGKDDFLAILMLLLSKQVKIRAITTVMGNSTLTNTTANARYLLNLTGSPIPLYAGAEKPLVRMFKPGKVMGITGLAGVNVAPTKILANEASRILAVATKADQLDLLMLGPLTNLAQALVKSPGLESKIKSLVIMGGAIKCRGNTNPYAEFNIFTDPDAAKIVFDTTIPKVLIPLDLCYQIPLYMSDFEKITNLRYRDTVLKIVKPYIRALKKYEGQDGAIVYDALAAYYLLNPSAFTLSPMYIDIETTQLSNLGQTMVDYKRRPNVFVATSLDKAKFVSDFITIINTGD